MSPKSKGRDSRSVKEIRHRSENGDAFGIPVALCIYFPVYLVAPPVMPFFSSSAACAAARRAVSTRNGEQET